MPQTIVSGHMAPLKTKRSRKFRFPKALVTTLVLLVVFVAGFYASVGLTALSQSNAKRTVHNFIAALNRGENTKAYGYTATTFREQQPQSQFNSLVSDLKADRTSFSYETISFNGSVASYTSVEGGLPQAADGTTTRTFALSLSKSGPLGWKIDSVSIN